MSQARDRSGAVPAHGDERRRLRRAAVFGTAAPEPPASDRPALRSLSGTIVDVRPDLLVVRTGDGEEVRPAMATDTTVWYGGRAGPEALRPGRKVVIRPADDGQRADRVWVDILRVTGTIITLDSEAVEVDAGPHRGRQHVMIPPRTLTRVLVRHPWFEPGFLLDVIAVHSPDGPLAVRPGTSQPGYRAGQATPPKSLGGPVPRTLRGTATWYGDAGRGAAYPSLDPEGQAGGCPGAPVSCAGLPFLSRGSDLLVRNECTARSATIPVTECGCAAARFCDRCVECGTSPRGRLVELTAGSFVDLGGDLDAGCFNVALTFG
jgi:hypothetical protein